MIVLDHRSNRAEELGTCRHRILKLFAAIITYCCIVQCILLGMKFHNSVLFKGLKVEQFEGGTV